MPKFHISKDGNPRPCEATKGCPLGEDAPHGDFTNETEARAWAEEVLERQNGGSFSSPKTKISKDLPRGEVFQGGLEEWDEVFETFEIKEGNILVSTPNEAGRAEGFYSPVTIQLEPVSDEDAKEQLYEIHGEFESGTVYLGRSADLEAEYLLIKNEDGQWFSGEVPPNTDEYVESDYDEDEDF